ncbi:hypothetical protein VKT23_019964 [Stygiomarasmius scandens]|uniref:Uncharacterized protein n=1 Tax=Marasmiellus scandens TaxID=2682957 RepID=A0ABR1IMU9_9AGAR
MSQGGGGGFSGQSNAASLIEDWKEYCSLIHKHHTPPVLNQEEFTIALLAVANGRPEGTTQPRVNPPVMTQPRINPAVTIQPRVNPDVPSSPQTEDEESDDYLAGHLKYSIAIPGPLHFYSLSPSQSPSPTKPKAASASPKKNIKTTLDISRNPECIPYIPKKSPTKQQSSSQAPLPSISTSSQAKQRVQYYVLDVSGSRKIVSEKERAQSLFEEMLASGLKPELTITSDLTSVIMNF